MKDIDRFIPVSEAKTRLLDLVRDLQAKDDIIAITKNGVPAAVLLSAEKFEGFLETIDILSDEKAMASLRRSRREARAGKWIGHEKVFGSA
ncbi:prevent-host-death protein [Candidatus Methylomirabilis lanthanidiphila]|uniref:Antitoxin n=1 Tax=Candidatus Methylomirabilis lanthanidiphila TaxID=2211376 RepID=A0A564ZHK3_9BACT|nr:type II toxin-antitoxin system Phd/YefM family antitoxin [Candidatus Methylomirabilis lanthanidiphila]VUZ84397.1 prevent-host-death protein [Candidatus Methylomirabilis lanthanidiphila]